MRLCRFPCGMSLAFRQGCDLFAATPPRRSLICINELTESQRLSAREAAKPQEQNPEAFRKTKPQRLSAREAAKSLSPGQNPRGFPQGKGKAANQSLQGVTPTRTKLLVLPLTVMVTCKSPALTIPSGSLTTT